MGYSNDTLFGQLSNLSSKLGAGNPVYNAERDKIVKDFSDPLLDEFEKSKKDGGHDFFSETVFRHNYRRPLLINNDYAMNAFGKMVKTLPIYEIALKHNRIEWILSIFFDLSIALTSAFVLVLFALSVPPSFFTYFVVCSLILLVAIFLAAFVQKQIRKAARYMEEKEINDAAKKMDKLMH